MNRDPKRSIDMRSCRKRAISAMIFIAAIASMACAGTFSPSLQVDTYTDAGHTNESFGNNESLWVASEKGSPVRIAYLTFTGMNVPPELIASGSLKIYIKEVERPGKVGLYLFDQAVLDTATWADQPGLGAEAVGTLDIKSSGWQTCDATTLVKKAAVECSQACPFSIALVGEGDASIAIASLESTPVAKANLQYETS